jgi:hypothetical protein
VLLALLSFLYLTLPCHHPSQVYTTYSKAELEAVLARVNADATA